MRKPRSLIKRVKYKESIIDVTSIAGLAEIIERHVSSIRLYEKKGIFPAAPIKIGSVRYYPISLCMQLKDIMKEVPGNRPPSPEILVEINKAFKLCQ